MSKPPFDPRARGAHSPVFIAALLLLPAWPAVSAAQASLVCQKYLARPDCTQVAGPWPATEPLHVVVSCQECTGGGSDVSCSAQEQVDAADLVLETTTSQPVDGSFSEIDRCIGLPLLRFSGQLSAGKQYRLVANVNGHGRVALLSFPTTGRGNPSDGGSAGAGADGSVVAADGGATHGPRDSGIPAVGGDSGGPAIGDDGGGSTGGDSGGCDCSSEGKPSTGALWALLGLFALFNRYRQRLYLAARRFSQRCGPGR